MKTTLLILSAALLIPFHALALQAAAPSPAPAVTVPKPPGKQAGPEITAAVTKVFEGYRDALAKRDGKAAASFVTKGNVDHYGEMLKLALKADEATLKKQPLTTQLFVLQLRHTIDTPELKKMNAQSAYHHAVKAGLLNADAFKDVKLDEVWVEGDVARAIYSRGGRQAPLYYEFQKDRSGAWKFDLTNLTAVADLGLKLAAEQAKVPTDAFLITIVEASSEKVVLESIWARPGVK